MAEFGSAMRSRCAPALLFLVITVCWMAPLITHLDSAVLRGPTDAALAIRGYWSMEAQHKNPFTITRDPFINAPEGVPAPAATQIAQPVQHAFIWVLKDAVGLVAAFNLFLLLGFVLTGVTAYWLLRYLALSRVASYYGAYVVTFNPWTFERALSGHAAFLHLWVILILAIALIAQHRCPTAKRAVLAGAAYGFTFWMASYWGLLASAVLIVFLIVSAARLRTGAERLWLCTLTCLNFGTALVMLLPAVIAYRSEQAAVSATFGHPAAALSDFAASGLDYLLPNPHQMLIGWIGEPFLTHNAVLSSERALFFGWVPIALTIAVLIHGFRMKTAPSSNSQYAADAFAVLLPCAFLLSLPPHLQLGHLSVPTLSDIVAHATTYYRVYARFGIVVGMCLAVLASLAIDALWVRGRRVVCLLLAIFTLIGLLPSSVTIWNADRPPAWDAWLRHEPRGIVANYPMQTDQRPALDLAAREVYYQRFTNDPLFAQFGTAWALTREGAIRLFTRYVTDPQTPGILSAEHVRYVVLHDDVYRAQGERPPTLSAAFRLIRRFGDVRIYDLTSTAKPVDVDSVLEQNAASIAAVYGFRAPIPSYGTGFQTIKVGANRGWFSTANGAQFVLNNRDARVRRAQIILRTRNGGAGNPVALQTPDGTDVAQTFIPSGESQITLGPFSIGSGKSSYHLESSDSLRHLAVDMSLIQPLADFSVSVRANP